MSTLRILRRQAKPGQDAIHSHTLDLTLHLGAIVGDFISLQDVYHGRWLCCCQKSHPAGWSIKRIKDRERQMISQLQIEISLQSL